MKHNSYIQLLPNPSGHGSIADNPRTKLDRFVLGETQKT